MCTAYWIAFGPHGPRTMPPPGEGMKVFTYTMIGVGVSAVIFGIVRYFARGTPRTMTKEYQEATNEYLKVRTLIKHDDSNHAGRGRIIACEHTISANRRVQLTLLSTNRSKTSSPSPVSAARVTSARAWCRALPRTRSNFLGTRERLCILSARQRFPCVDCTVRGEMGLVVS